MTQLAELFGQGKYEDLWRTCCGFIDLSQEDFMRIQKRLLLEQIGFLSKCALGKRLLNGEIPTSVEEFREEVPLTTYDDYAPYLLKRRMDVLPRKPLLWQYTSGKSGEYAYRWVPVTSRLVDEMEPYIFALMIFASCKKKGEVNIRKGDKFLYGMAPPPYATGTMARIFPNEMFDLLPTLEKAESMSFEERVKEGFERALIEGMDLNFSMSSLTVAIGRRFKDEGRKKTTLKEFLRKNPSAQLRLAKALIKAKMAGRPILPKDLWKVKGLITYGIDGDVFREKIKDMWGCYPLDFHGCTEAMIIAMQTWDHQAMTFVPNLQFLEFIPEKDALRSREEPEFKPRTLLLDEIIPGKYELVITSFHGGPFVRYRLGHLVKIHSLRNEKLGINIPQMSFIDRVDDQIDIAGFTRLGEKAIWQAVENTGLDYEDWVARKETNGKTEMNIYIELKEASRFVPLPKVTSLIHNELKKLDQPYYELGTFADIKPLRVTLLPEGAFKSYKLRQQAAGAGLDNLKPAHVNPPAETIDFLVKTAVMVPTQNKQTIKV
jgi:hypothetical protein